MLLLKSVSPLKTDFKVLEEENLGQTQGVVEGDNSRRVSETHKGTNLLRDKTHAHTHTSLSTLETSVTLYLGC